MSSFLSQEVIEEVRQAADIVTVVSEHLTLKRIGTNYQAICPFHSEKTPSFSVNAQKQIFKCFGCGKAGNVFHFLMAIENISFPDAVRNLARRFGIFLREDSASVDKDREEQKTLWELMEWTTNFYQKQLSLYPQGLEYLKNRFLSPAIMEQFRLGMAPVGWGILMESAKKSGFSEEALEKTGLIIKSTKNQEKYYDRFRNRVVFPIGNMDGKTIAFGARSLSPEDQPKYLNSPETLLFSKSKTLYGWNFAKNSILEKKSLIIMEGYTDVLMAHQYGFTTAVATLGTALTEEHTKIIKRYAGSVILLFDGDNAGRKAADRSIHFFVKEGINVHIVVLPDDLDPCDFLIQRGKDAFQERIEKAEDFWDFQIRSIASHHDLKNTSGKRYAIQEVAKTISLIPDAVSRRLVLNRVGEIFKIPPEILDSQITSLEKKNTGNFSQTEQIKEKLQAEDEKFLIWSMLHYPEKIEQISFCYPVSEFKDTNWKEVANKIHEYWLDYNTVNLASLLSRIDSSIAPHLVHLYHANYGILENNILEERLNLVFKGLEKAKYLRELAKLRQTLCNIHPVQQEAKSQILHNARQLCRTHVASQHISGDKD